nr:retrovirus-related Pol polyprotein from transposon TNT 1-94 [Tanacetum cinerariifolium]
MVLEKKVNFKPVNYAILNQLSKDFGKRFVPQTELAAEQAFWLKSSSCSEEPSTSSTPVKTNVPKTLKRKGVVDNDAQVSNATTIAPGLYKFDPVTLAPKNMNNREAHIYYLKHNMEQVAILREIVEQAKSLNPLDSASYSAVRRTFTLVGNACRLTRITTTNKVHFMEPAPLEVVTQEPVVTKVYTRRPKVPKTIGSNSKSKIAKSMISNKIEPGTSRGSNTSVAPSSSSLVNLRKPNLSYLHVFGALCYPTNDSENLGKLQAKADIGIFIGYAPKKKAYRIYNRRTRKIIETIHVDFDELIAMAFEQSNLEPALHEITPATPTSGLVPNPPPPAPFVPPSRNEWDLVFHDYVETPMMEKSKLNEDLQGTPVDAILYRGMIGSLMYLTSSRPNLIYADTDMSLTTYLDANHVGCQDTRRSTSQNAQFLGDKLISWSSKKPKGTINMVLWYSKDTGMSLTTYSDADHTGCQDTRRSTSQSAQFLGDKLISWSSKKQKSDYSVLRQKSAIALCCNNVQHSRAKHIDVRYHFIKEQVDNGIVELYFVRTEYQLADIFTKPLLRERFNFMIYP